MSIYGHDKSLGGSEGRDCPFERTIVITYIVERKLTLIQIWNGVVEQFYMTS